MELALAALTLLVKSDDGSASGFLYDMNAGLSGDPDWVVITNQHVIEGDSNIEVCWAVTQTCKDATVRRQGSEEFDVAILDYKRFNPDRTTEEWLSNIALSDWHGWGEEWEKGDVVFAAGYPSTTTEWYGRYRIPPPVVTEGTVYQDSTAFKRVGRAGETMYTGHYLEHSAEISGGNSGGPLMNAEGWIIGVNSSASHEPKRVEGAIPMTYVIHWADTGEEPSDYWTLKTLDGGLYAVLTWTQQGEPGWRYVDEDDNPCVTLVYEKRENWYEWNRPICQVSGYEADDGEVYFEHDGEWYHAPEIPLSEKPDWG